MQNVKDMALEIVSKEGGYVNDPDDPGGPTNFGVTLQTLKEIGHQGRFGAAIGLRDLKSLTKSDAADIFCKFYFYKPRIHLLPPSIHDVVFDMSVNSGSRAIKLLQQSANLAGEVLVVDGQIGPKTQEHVNALITNQAYPMRDIYSIERREFYFRLADKRVSLRKFARSKSGSKGGWIKRAEAFLNSRFHMTQKEFEERTALWD